MSLLQAIIADRFIRAISPDVPFTFTVATFYVVLNLPVHFVVYRGIPDTYLYLFGRGSEGLTTSTNLSPNLKFVNFPSFVLALTDLIALTISTVLLLNIFSISPLSKERGMFLT